MARRAWKLPTDVIEGHRIPVCTIRPDRFGGFRLVIEGNLMSYSGSRRQMEAVSDWVSLNWFELRRIVSLGPDPEWLSRLIVRKAIRPTQEEVE